MKPLLYYFDFRPEQQLYFLQIFQIYQHDILNFFYFYQYGLLAIMGTMALLIVQTICSVAVVCYFHVGKHHPESAHWFSTFTAPILGAIGMAYVVYLLFDNLTFAAGAASGSPVFTATPYIVLGTFVLGILGALALRRWSPEIYERTGRVVMDETHER